MLRLRAVFATPGMTSLYLTTFLGRSIGSGGPMLITLYAVTTLDRSYSEAAWVNTILVLGMGIGAPVSGWALDRGRGRLLVGVTAVIEAAFWLSAGHVGYLSLLIAAIATSAFVLPSFTLARWVIATQVDESSRQAAYTVDSICNEASYMIGPPVAILLATNWGAGPAFTILGGLTVVVGIALLKPAQTMRVTAGQPMTSDQTTQLKEPPSPRLALRAARGPFVLVGAAMTLLAGTEVLLIALMRSQHELNHLSYVVFAWCTSSIIGALVFTAGGLPTNATVLFGIMAVGTTLIGLGSSWWQTILLLIPSGSLNAAVLAASSEWLNRVVPLPLRGRFTGWYTLALTLGLAVGAPVGGVLADHAPIWLSFGVLGIFGLLAAIFAASLSRPTAAHSSRIVRSSRLRS